ncbi:MAG: hypothetical protein ABH887_01080 [bacterium]
MKTFLIEFYDKFIVNWPVWFDKWQENIFYLKIIFVGISIVLFIGIIYYIILIRRDIKKYFELIIDSVEAPKVPKKKVTKQWEGIIQKLESDNTSDYKLAVIEADKMLDELLKRIGYKGDDMGARLKQLTSAQVPNLNELWSAHKVRNRIAHESNFNLTRETARRAIDAYERTFEELELL